MSPPSLLSRYPASYPGHTRRPPTRSPHGIPGLQQQSPKVLGWGLGAFGHVFRCSCTGFDCDPLGGCITTWLGPVTTLRGPSWELALEFAELGSLSPRAVVCLANGLTLQAFFSVQLPRWNPLHSSAVITSIEKIPTLHHIFIGRHNSTFIHEFRSKYGEFWPALPHADEYSNFNKIPPVHTNHALNDPLLI